MNCSEGGHKHGLSCAQLCSFLCDFVGKELPAEQDEAFRQHLRECPACAEYLRQYETTIRMCKKCMCPGQTRPPPVPSEMVSAIMKALGKK